MQRLARLDARGVLNQVVAQGIEPRRIFSDSTDQDDLLARFEDRITKTSTFCYVWPLLPSHAEKGNFLKPEGL